jgi:hypothetical protein
MGEAGHALFLFPKFLKKLRNFSDSSSRKRFSYFLLERLRFCDDGASEGLPISSGHIEPSKATCRIRPTTNANLMVTPPIFCAGYAPTGARLLALIFHRNIPVVGA